MSSTYVYRVLKSSWGIWVKITANAEVSVPPSSEPPGRGARAIVEFSGSALELEDELKNEVRGGIQRIERDILTANKGQDVLIAVEAVEFNAADFQREGLSVAIIRWAEREFNLSPHRIDVSFDRPSNSYLFTYV